MQKRFHTLLAPENRGGNLRPAAGASVTVTDPNGALATIYSDNGVTVAANPLTSSATGYYEYYAADGRYTETIVKTGRDTVTISDILLEDPADSPSPTSADMASTAANKGAGLVGFSALVEYAAGTVGKWLADLKSSIGASLVGFIQAGAGAVERTAQDKLRETVSVKDFGAAGDGVTDDSDALEAFWQYIRDSRVNYDPSTLDWVPTAYVIPPGIYRVTRSINWTNLRAWNVHIEAKGAMIVGEVNAKAVVDMCDCRGIHVDGLVIQTASGYVPNSAILIGPSTTNTCGNNRFSNVKTAGDYAIAACHNIGSETTLNDFCYWQNKIGTGYAYAADCNNLLGAVSDHVTLRASGVPVSFTSNAFQGCRFANYAASGNSVYLEGTAGWTFDAMCYFLSFDNANVVIRQAVSNRTAALRLAGLFETTQGAGVKHVVKFVVDDGVTSACDGFELDVATPHAITSIIRLETPSGAEMTTGSFSIRSARIKMDAIYAGSPTLFSGARLSFAGELRVRPSAAINLSALIDMHGIIYTADASLITKAAASAGHAYFIVDDQTLSKQGMQVAGGGTGSVAFQAGTVPRVRAMGSAADYDLWLSGQGAGLVRFGTLTANADAAITGYITIKDSGGASRKLAVIT